MNYNIYEVDEDTAYYLKKQKNGFDSCEATIKSKIIEEEENE